MMEVLVSRPAPLKQSSAEHCHLLDWSWIWQIYLGELIFSPAIFVMHFTGCL